MKQVFRVLKSSNSLPRLQQAPPPRQMREVVDVGLGVVKGVPSPPPVEKSQLANEPSKSIFE
jgi:hypothetical protein